MLIAARLSAVEVARWDTVPRLRSILEWRSSRIPDDGGDGAAVEYADGAIALCADGSGLVTGIPERDPSRVGELVDLLAEADNVLEETLRETLTREALGLDGRRDEGGGPI